MQKKGIITPKEDIKHFCKFVGITQKNFFDICNKFRNKKIWIKKNNKWYLNNFIIKDLMFK